jgi:hypothetical protein
MTVSAPAVSRALGKHHTRSESHTTRVRGWLHYTAGFEVREYDDAVSVDHVLGDNARYWDREMRLKSTNRALDHYTTTLTRAGYSVERTDGPWNPRLIVTKEDTA